MERAFRDREQHKAKDWRQDVRCVQESEYLQYKRKADLWSLVQVLGLFLRRTGRPLKRMTWSYLWLLSEG